MCRIAENIFLVACSQKTADSYWNLPFSTKSTLICGWVNPPSGDEMLSAVG